MSDHIPDVGKMMNDLIISGIDHGKFDLEWAKRGGVVLI